MKPSLMYSQDFIDINATGQAELKSRKQISAKIVHLKYMH